MRNVQNTKTHEQDYDEHGYEFPTVLLCYEVDWNDWLLIHVYPLLWFISKWTSRLPMFAIWRWPLEWAINTLYYCFEYKTPWSGTNGFAFRFVIVDITDYKFLGEQILSFASSI